MRTNNQRHEALGHKTNLKSKITMDEELTTKNYQLMTEDNDCLAAYDCD